MTHVHYINKNRAYKKLLNKMLIIENSGEALYRALSSKTKDNDIKLIYEKLALNEQETAKCIEKQILLISGKDHYILINKVVLCLANIGFLVLTARQLARVLKKVLKRKIYSKWYNEYNDNNQNFWRILLNHENLQHELLGRIINN